MFWVLRLPAPELIAVRHGLGLAVTQEDAGRVDVESLAGVVRRVALPLSTIVSGKVRTCYDGGPQSSHLAPGKLNTALYIDQTELVTGHGQLDQVFITELLGWN